jgi:hypothetical protein
VKAELKHVGMRMILFDWLEMEKSFDVRFSKSGALTRFIGYMGPIR